MKAMTTTALTLTILLLTGCATSLDGERYQEQAPEFDLFTFFDGDIKAWGIVQDRSGEVTQRFIVTIDGSVDGDTLELDETFEYSLGDGVKHRVWSITRGADGSYSGGAGDIIGTAQGEAHGNAFRWSYAMDLPVGDSTYKVTFEDWIWQLDEDTIINRSWIQKFGIDFAEVTIFMRRVSP